MSRHTIVRLMPALALVAALLTSASVAVSVLSTSADAAPTGGGTLWSWGWNGNGQLGNGMTTDSHVPLQVPGLTQVVAVGGTINHSLAVMSDGTVQA